MVFDVQGLCSFADIISVLLGYWMAKTWSGLCGQGNSFGFISSFSIKVDLASWALARGAGTMKPVPWPVTKLLAHWCAGVPVISGISF